MNLKERIDADLKAALLGGDKTAATTLRGLKSAILYEEVAQNARETGLSEEAMVSVLAKEAKKRQESADLYAQGGNTERQNAELVEKKLIEKYLPEQLSDEKLGEIIDACLSEVENPSPQSMGQVIGLVKQKVGSSADGGRIATLVKERLSK